MLILPFTHLSCPFIDPRSESNSYSCGASNSPNPLFLNPDISARLFPLTLPFIIPTPTIIHLPNPRTIESLFVQAFIDLVVHRTSPHLRRFSSTDLRWVLLQYLLEMRGALAAWVQTREQVDI